MQNVKERNLLNMQEVDTIKTKYRVGTDLSFDLIIETIPKNDNNPIMIDVYPDNIKEYAIKILHMALEKLNFKVETLNYSLKIIVRNKIPDVFVWLGRLEGIINLINENKR